MTTIAIETRQLRKVYGSQRHPKLALADLSLQVVAGEAVGLLGPNGAGKSTCIKLLLGLARPTSGWGRLLGRPLGEVAARGRVGFLPEHFHFQEWLSGGELLWLHGRLFGLDRAVLRRRVPALLERVGLEHEGAKPVREYSKGMQQRIGLAQALVNEPDLIFLDEPTSGLDPLGRLLVRDIIREQRERGAAVLLNSHLLGEVESSCDRVVFLQEGQLVGAQRLRSAEIDGPVRLRVRARNAPEAFWPRFAAAHGGTAQPQDGAWRLELADEAAVPALLRELVGAGADIYEVTRIAWSLEETFVRIMTANPDGDAHGVAR